MSGLLWVQFPFITCFSHILSCFFKCVTLGGVGKLDTLKDVEVTEILFTHLSKVYYNYAFGSS